MSFVYLVALIAVSTALIGALAEAVLALSRKPVWAESSRKPGLVVSQDRRTQSLPFVGAERRRNLARALQARQDNRAA